MNAIEIEYLLNSQVMGRIGCRYGDSIYIVPISYAYDGEYIYCHTQEGMKVHLMREYPKVCFEVEHMTDMANWQTVIGWGVFEEMTDPGERNYALNKLHERILPMISSETVQLSADWPFKPSEPGTIEGVTFRIHLAEKNGRFERSQTENFFAS